MSWSKNILIIGAGIGGDLLEQDIRKKHPDLYVVGFVDDNSSRNKDVRLLGGLQDINRITREYRVDEIIFAIPSASGNVIRMLLMECQGNRIPIKIIPRTQHVISESDVSYSEVRDLEPGDFLGRPFVKEEITRLKNFYKGKTVLVTGGAGSIGREIFRQLLDVGAKKVIVYDNSEYLCFQLLQQLREESISTQRYKIIIGSILNRGKLDYVMRAYKPDMVFHAAAYKHVFLMEENIDEAVRTNVLGSRNVIDSAQKHDVPQFVFISTDKVVNPTSVMGATKKLCEYYIQSLGKTKTRFSIVRFGNVINSHGSVLPIFERQIQELGYVTVTHRKIERFFMSIAEAAHLVLTSAVRKTDGDVYILNMEELIKVYEAAQCLIRSKNKLVGEDIDIKIIGLRKGEKMIEELHTDLEKKNMVKTEFDNITRLKNYEKCFIDERIVFESIDGLLLKYPSKKQLYILLKKIFPSIK